MNCVKCGSPIYFPSPNDLCPKCEGEILDKWIADQEAKRGVLPSGKEKNTEKPVKRYQVRG